MRMKVKLVLICLFFVLGFIDCFSQSKGVVCVYKATPPNRSANNEKGRDLDDKIWKLYEVSYKNKEYLCEKKQEKGDYVLTEDYLKQYINFNDESSISQIDYTYAITQSITKYLVEDKVQTYDWQITTDTMTIEGNLCYKAYFTKKPVNGRTLMYVAWFCPDISLPIGPYGYCGLPGLVVRLQVPFMNFALQSIVYTDEGNVEQPKEGKRISREDYKNMVDKDSEKIRKISESNEPIIQHGQL